IFTAPAIFTVTNGQPKVLSYLPAGSSVNQLIQANGGILYVSSFGSATGLYSVTPAGKLNKVSAQFFGNTLCVGPNDMLYGITAFYEPSSGLYPWQPYIVSI